MPKAGQPGSRECRQRTGDRDGWVCGICTGLVDPQLSVYESIWAAVVDHIVSKADGGSDHPGNLQIAHYECNRLKHQVSTGTRRELTCPRCERRLVTRARKMTNRHCLGCGAHVRVVPPRLAGARTASYPATE